MLRGIKGTGSGGRKLYNLFILLFHSQIPLLISHYSLNIYPLFSLFTMYSALRAWLGQMPEGETRLTLTLRIPQNLHWSEKAGERRRSSREGLRMTESYSINSLQSASLDVDVDDVIIMISGHSTKLHYFSIRAIWGSRDLISRHIILA